MVSEALIWLLALVASIVGHCEGLDDASWSLTTNSLPTNSNDGVDLKRMASVGNGHIASVVYSDTIYMNGLYNGVRGWSHRAEIRSHHDVRILVNDTTNNQTYKLDMWKGWFEETINTLTSTIKLRTYAHQHYTQLMVTEIEIIRTQNIVNDSLVLTLQRSSLTSTDDILLDAPEPHTGVERCSANCMKTRGITKEAESDRISVAEVFLFWTDIPSSLMLAPDEVYKNWTFVTSIDSDMDRAQTVFQSAMNKLNSKRGELQQNHVDSWTDKWKKGRIDVEGDTELNTLVHSSMYYTLSSLPSTDPNQPNEPFYGLSPGGLANGDNSSDFRGHVLVDMEAWMFPPFLMFFPEIAKSLLNYRVRNMEAAGEAATTRGYQGLRYPSESGVSGDELSFGEMNHEFITADIAFAARQYISATRDLNWLRGDSGYTFIRDLANFWESRALWNDVKSAYEISGVTGPDENAVNVSNSVYTNVAVKMAIKFSRYVACLTDLENVNEIKEEWLGKATKIFIPYDDSRMYHPEYVGYVSAVVKGVDAILLGFPLMFEMNETVRRSDLAIYENLTDPKSSAMTWAMFAINLLEMGDTEKAFTFFQKSHSGYPRKPFNVWNKEVSGEGDINFSGMGTFLQTLIFGYGGARLHVETLTFEPKLPTNVTSLHFIGLDYLGTTFDLYIKSNRVIIVVQQTSDYSIYLRLVSTNTEFHLMNGKEIMIPRTAFTLYTTNITDCPLPEGSSCPTSVSDNGQMSSLEGNEDVNNPIQYVVVKQTGGDKCADHWTCTSRERAIQKEDGSYNFLIGQDGRIYIGSGWQLQTNTRLNTTTLTIGMIGDFICNTPNEKSLGALQHLLKCGISRKLLSERYVILSNHQLLKNAEILANHNQLYCGIMSSRHWMEYQYEGDFNPPVCDGECFQPQIKPDSLYRDISDQPTIFEATELPMKDGKIDFRYMASVGNGHLATVIYSPTIYINGLFNGPTGWSHRARIPSTHAIRIAVPGSNTFNISHNYKLDVQQAIFEETIDTPSAVVKQRTYAHQYYNRLLVTEIELIRKEEAVEDIVILLSNNPGSNSEDINFNEPENITNHKDFSKYSIECWYQDGVTLQTEINSTDPQNVYMYSTKLPTSLELDENVKHQTWVYVTSIDIRKNAAEESFTKALSLLIKDTQALYTSHIAAWETRWAEGRIVLEGDNYISKRIYGSFYYLLSFLPATDPFIKNNQFYGLSPGGLANGANWTDYQGHVFWDMETWMYPTMLMFHPDLAKEMLSYRIYAMEPAYERAKITDPVSKGLRYPWESALTGVEQTPDICVPCRENQQHITGDIALAARQYLSVTKDLTWLKREQGFTFIRDMAEFWASRPVYNPARDSYDVNGVMPPDEHAQNINNSAYTNVGAKLSIYFAEYAACLMGNHSYDIPEYWLNVADKLYLPFNAGKNYHPEFEGYEDWTDERGVKQADTIMLGYPQMWAVDTEVRRNDLIHYEKVTNPMGPAMTWGMFSIGWLELGDEHKAHELFHRSYSPYVREPFKIWTEARSGIGAVNFITGMGGFLQAVYFGYGGARIYTEHMEFNPRLPPGNTALKFLGMNYLKNSLDIEIYEKKMLIILRKTAVENQLFVQIHSSGAEIILTEGKEVVLVRQAFSLRSKSLSGCLLPKDEILKAENCPRIISRSTWGGEPACDSEKTDDMVNNIIIKHTGSSSCSDFTTCSRIVEDIQTGEMKNGSSDISYNFLLGDDKRIYQGRGWGVIPGLGGERSPRTLAIGIIGDYSCKPLSWNTLYKVKRLIRCGIEGKKISTGYIISVEKNTPQLYNQIMEWRNQPLIEYSQACDETIPDLQGDIKDINGTETVFKSKSLPMKDGEIDYRYMASIGNGHIATIALSPTVYMNGLYNGEMGYTHRARIPSLVSYNIKVNDEDTTRSYSLDVQKAVFIEMIDTPTLTIEYRVYAHQYYVRLLVAEIIVTRKMQQAEESTVFVTRRVTSFESEDIVFNESIPITEKHVCGNWNCKRRHGRTKIPESGKVDLKDVYVLWNELPTTLTLSANKMSDRWISLVAIDPAKERCELDFSAGQRDVVADTNLVYQRHIDAWSKKWDNGRIEIKDNLQLSKLVYGSLYYILSSLPSDSTYLPTNQFFGLSPGGLANGANFTDYQGHVFWDMETWMYPGILMFHPELAKAMLSYRLFSMPAARERAGAGGYDGIRYPWEGGSTGAEVTPDICIPCRENQQHVTGDIAFAARQYVSATRDLQWLKTEMGYQFIREMAAFWVSRAEEDWNNETMMYNINGVMPPDEYQIRINNSVYTNIGAKLSIMFAEYAACLAGTAEDDAMIEKWRHVADNIYVPFNEFKRYHPEFEGFEDVTGDRKIIKQADAILTGFPQMWSMPEDVRRNDLELYEKITDHGGPAMTWGMFSIGWLELGDENKAREFFHKSYSPYVREPFKVWTEAQSGIGAVNFITGMGGFLQAVLFGYGGVRLRVEKLEFDPEIIPGTSGMRLVGLDYLGNSLNIDVYEEVIKIVKTKASEHTIDLVTSDSKIKFILHSHREYKIKRQAFTIQALTVTECPLPEGNSCPYVVPRSSWFTSKMEGIRQSMESVTEVVIDQTNDVSCTNYKNCIQQLQLMKKTSQLKGEIDISYNFLVDMSGNVYEGTGWEYTTSTLTSRLVIGVFGDYTCMDVKLRSVAAIKNLIKCGLEMEKISKSYALVSGRQTRKPDCLTTTCMGDSLLCTIMKWKYWNNTQYDGTFVAPNCYGSCVHPSKAEWNKNSIYHDISTEPTVFQTNK